MNTFDPILHRYKINSRPVPSVTQVIHEMFKEYIHNADDFYLTKGSAVHAAAAFVARGKSFSFCSQISGKVEAVKRFFREVKPEVIEVEQPIYSSRWMYAGTPDAVMRINGRVVIVDYKSSMDKLTQGLAQIQIGAYALEKPEVKWGMAVALFDDGNYKCGEMFKAARYGQDFLNDLGSYNQRARLGLIRN